MRKKITRRAELEIAGAFRAGGDWAKAAQIAGCTRQALWYHQARHPKVKELWESAREEANDVVVKSLFLRAIKGDLGAMIFWLKNRRPSEWKERPDAQINFVFGSPVWQRFEAAVTAALDKYPEAKAEVVRALEGTRAVEGVKVDEAEGGNAGPGN